MAIRTLHTRGMAAHVVLGMHRSGTSLVASLLELAGCCLGPSELLAGAAFDNPRGFFENRNVVALNDAALAAAGARWFDVLPIIDGGLDLVDRRAFESRAADVLSWTTTDMPWAVKDPRVVPLFPLWRSVLDDPTVVIPIRHPAEVAHSLHARDHMPLEVAAALWEFHVVRALEDSRGLRRHVILHDRLLADPIGSVRSLVSALDHPRLTIPQDGDILGRVDRSLHRSRADAIGLHEVVSPEQHELYAILAECDDPERLPALSISSAARTALGRYRRSDTKPIPLQARGGNRDRRRTAVVVQGCRLKVFEPSLQACRDTWASRPHEDVDVLFAYGNGCDDHDLSGLESPDGEPLPPVPDGMVARYGDVLAIGCSDLIAHQSDALLRKRLLSLRQLLETDDHDAFLLVCASSYVDTDVLAAHVANLDLDGIFQGPVFIAEETGRVMVSGSAILLSRDLAQRLVADAARLLTASGYRYADDVAISDWVAREISDTDPLEMLARVEAGRPATTDNTFLQPPVWMLDYRAMKVDRHVKVEGSYHYHFATDEPSTMRRFHERYYYSSSGRSIPSSESTIFIQIASYRDRELPRTIASALDRADHADRLRFGICWQYDEETLDDLEQFATDKRFRIDEVYYRKSEGCTWARNRADRFFEGEDFYLQIDAHMRFADGWDTKLIDMLSAIDAEKPVLTVYPPGYTTDGQGNDDYAEMSGVHVLALESINEHLQTRQCTRVAPDQTAPGKSPLVAAGFLFAQGSVLFRGSL